ncbi:hypothetical protein AAHE18_11G134000 [Arachis hypogaea]
MIFLPPFSTHDQYELEVSFVTRGTSSQWLRSMPHFKGNLKVALFHYIPPISKFHSTHFTAPPEIPSAPTVLQLGSFHRLSRVEPWDLTANLKSHLQTLYAQSFRIMLASSVLPRLLAQS